MLKRNFLCSLIFVLVFLSNQVKAKEEKPAFISLTIQGYIKDNVRLPQLFANQKQSSLQSMISFLKIASRDSKVTGLIIKLKSPKLGWGKLLELRNALTAFKLQGKPIYAYSETLSKSDYLLASVANKVFMSPQGSVELSGIALELVFLKDAFDFLGVSPNFHQEGDYKSASEIYTHSKSTQYQRDSINFLLDGLYEQFISNLSKSRQISKAKLKKLIEQGFFSAEEAKSAGLIDDFLYEDIFLGLVNKQGTILSRYLKPNHPKSQKINFLQILSLISKKPSKKSKAPKIAIIYLDGVIVSGRSSKNLFGKSSIGSEDFSSIFQTVKKDDTVKAVVLRINSPGGSALASDIMWREIKLLSQKKPVIASLSDVAASGGYYIAVACPTIIASPATVTGSIGVVGGKFNLKGVYDKLKVRKEIFKRGKHADIFTDYRDFSDDEKKMIARQMSHTYHVFISKVAEGRNISIKKINELAKGKVYTGSQAQKVGLVDQLGGLDLAIEMARDKAHDKKNQFEIISYPEQIDLLDLIKMNVGAKSELIKEINELDFFVAPVMIYIHDVYQILVKERIAILTPFLMQYK